MDGRAACKIWEVGGEVTMVKNIQAYVGMGKGEANIWKGNWPDAERRKQ